MFSLIASMLIHHLAQYHLLIRLHLIGQNLIIMIPQKLWRLKAWDGPGTEQRVLWWQGQSEFGHGYVEVVPRTHPQFIFV